MLGIVRPCRHHLSPSLHRRWTAHLCGTCLALRDGHGQIARSATNVDALLVSVLTTAQAPADVDRRAGPCPARGMRTATVVSGDGARLAAHAALLLAAGHVADHADDRQGAFRHGPVAAVGRRVAARWSDRARASAPPGFDPSALLAVPARQHAVEHGAGVVTLDEATAPTADAVSAAFAHTAVLAGRPGNAAPLAAAGAAFGRLAHLLDALDDLCDDRRHGRWNPVDATGAGVEATRAHARRQVAVLAAVLPRVELPAPEGLDARLTHRLLVHETDRALARSHARTEQPPTDQPQQPGDPGHARPPRGFVAGCVAAAGLCCTGQLCCADEFTGPWSGRPRSNPCANCGDCSECGCDCCDCCPDGDGCCACGDCGN
ncbi:DUF5685 family protein [Actinomycetospora cinnamomea]|uniref:Regulatory protein n=1 Tax=Actinomycetospora cinnamomea TaxID=663609 RepID=A0A2U1EWG5_9PSEU|nr:DUF5685 family protein [Actinomycetospora cinnamomea]PVZ04283.1 hypothetical protein C8D89_11871 [Actinomycetospora cinnamomea]